MTYTILRLRVILLNHTMQLSAVVLNLHRSARSEKLFIKNRQANIIDRLSQMAYWRHIDVCLR